MAKDIKRNFKNVHIRPSRVVLKKSSRSLMLAQIDFHRKIEAVDPPKVRLTEPDDNYYKDYE